jgi:hypothetical protein
VQAPLAEVQHPVGDRGRLGLVGDEHDGASRQAAEKFEHGRAVRLVEVPGRLVGEHERRVGDERPRDREPLLLAA